MVLAVVVYVPESKAARARRVDPLGQALIFVALTSLTYAVTEGPLRDGTSPRILSLFVIALLAVSALLAYEAWRADPLLELRFFRSMPFRRATVIAVCSFAGFAADRCMACRPSATGLCTLPLALLTILRAPLSGRLAEPPACDPPYCWQALPCVRPQFRGGNPSRLVDHGWLRLHGQAARLDRQHNLAPDDRSPDIAFSVSASAAYTFGTR